eukprot:CAMPEP_0197850912 /NCGR_PEP_ID=MMETSP1438-20131217/16736_1 /TAXON_ID=1461541 /ORGANISM="Pterosperma sp., Strain CCMP1384" /LENGTH=690 /DNA_ID=CAMNT_0043464313 /DNA_START=413 /DNA_END=2485 /DNA_ORIENTATION=+
MPSPSGVSSSVVNSHFRVPESNTSESCPSPAVSAGTPSLQEHSASRELEHERQQEEEEQQQRLKDERVENERLQQEKDEKEKATRLELEKLQERERLRKARAEKQRLARKAKQEEQKRAKAEADKLLKQKVEEERRSVEVSALDSSRTQPAQERQAVDLGSQDYNDAKRVELELHAELDRAEREQKSKKKRNKCAKGYDPHSQNLQSIADDLSILDGWFTGPKADTEPPAPAATTVGAELDMSPEELLSALDEEDVMSKPSQAGADVPSGSLSTGAKERETPKAITIPSSCNKRAFTKPASKLTMLRNKLLSRAGMAFGDDDSSEETGSHPGATAQDDGDASSGAHDDSAFNPVPTSNKSVLDDAMGGVTEEVSKEDRLPTTSAVSTVMERAWPLVRQLKLGSVSDSEVLGALQSLSALDMDQKTVESLRLPEFLTAMQKQCSSQNQDQWKIKGICNIMLRTFQVRFSSTTRGPAALKSSGSGSGIEGIQRQLSVGDSSGTQLYSPLQRGNSIPSSTVNSKCSPVPAASMAPPLTTTTDLTVANSSEIFLDGTPLAQHLEQHKCDFDITSALHTQSQLLKADSGTLLTQEQMLELAGTATLNMAKSSIFERDLDSAAQKFALAGHLRHQRLLLQQQLSSKRNGSALTDQAAKKQKVARSNRISSVPVGDPSVTSPDTLPCAQTNSSLYDF